MTQNLARFLQETVDGNLAALRDLSDNDTGRPRDGGGWSSKEELGHLLDSAVNNRVRFVRAALEPEYSGPTYDGAGWVRLTGYNDLPWTTLLELWQRENALLAHLVGRIPEEKLQTRCTVEPHPPVTLEFLIDDYVRHMQHHLDHILKRPKLAEYPGAALGI